MSSMDDLLCPPWTSPVDDPLCAKPEPDPKVHDVVVLLCQAYGVTKKGLEAHTVRPLSEQDREAARSQARGGKHEG